jgi:hypothetical protein
MLHNKSHKSMNKPNRGVQRVILGFHHEAAENYTPLGYYAASSGNFSPAFWHNLAVPFSAPPPPLEPRGWDRQVFPKRCIHQLLSGLAETLATVYWLQRELLRRGQEALVVRLNFVFFTDSVSQLYGQRMYVLKYIFFSSNILSISFYITAQKMRNLNESNVLTTTESINRTVKRKMLRK